MRILILGHGGREHALAVTLAREAHVLEVTVHPGNPGISGPKIKLLSQKLAKPELVSWAREAEINLVVVGPENLLADGMVDLFEEVKIPVYGPRAKAAELETSKIFAKKFLKENGIPTAKFVEAFDFTKSLELLKKENPIFENGVVVKLSGLHAGKGVVVTNSIEEAIEVVTEFEKQNPKLFSEGIVFEEKLTGKEVSVFYSCLEDRFVFLGEACDHKRLLNGDQGPNTGGMGAYSPCPWLTTENRTFIEEKILKPTLNGMVKSGNAFCGTLFLGLMVDGKNINVIEYNTRFGDPETQTFLPLLDGALSELFLAVAKKDKTYFQNIKISRKPLKAVHVVKVSENYPQPPKKGDEIFQNPNTESSAPLFYAGVDKLGDKLVTSGGRVFGVTGIGPSFSEAAALAYKTILKTSFRGEYYRTDIAKAALPVRIAILASGTGTNALKLTEKAHTLSRIQVGCVIVDRASSALLSKENQKILNTPVFLIEKTKDMSKEEHERKIIEVIENHQCDWVLLAGYMRIFSPLFIRRFKNQIVNIHPSLLPAFPGMAGYEQAYEAEVKESGVTVHFVDEGVDTGPVWKQARFKREPGDTLETFIQKGKNLEWQIYPEFLEWLDQI